MTTTRNRTTQTRPRSARSTTTSTRRSTKSSRPQPVSERRPTARQVAQRRQATQQKVSQRQPKKSQPGRASRSSSRVADRSTRAQRSASKARANRILDSSISGAREVNIRRRILALLAVFLLAGIAYVGVLVDLQAVRPEEYTLVGEGQRTRTVNLPGYRGTITDRDGFVLALSTPGTEVVADPQMIENVSATAELLAPILGVQASELVSDLLPSSESDRYALVAQSLTDDQAARIALLAEDSANDDALVGIFVQAQESRVYPAGDLALPIIGRVNNHEVGIFGMEWQLGETMQGTAGYQESEAGAFGSITGGDYVFSPAVAGNDVALTIDHRIQYVMEQSLLEHCEETQAQGANAVAVDPRTGEIFAMATVVRQNGVCVIPKYNAPLVELFEPGSVIKMVTAAAAVESSGLTANSVLNVPETLTVGDKDFENHFEAAPYPVRQIISDSMNAGTIMLAQDVGADTLRDYLYEFGFGARTGIDFKDEARGAIPDEWYGSDIGSIAIGQGISVNTVQLAAAYNVIANGGQYIQPSLVRSITDAQGQVVSPTPRESRRVVSEETAAEVTNMLVDVVTTGTGTEAAIRGYTVAGKTGTAWQAFEQADGSVGYGSDGDRRYVVTFAGFVPAESPQLSIVVVVDEPTTAQTASKIAAPVFADIAQYAIRILAIPPGGATATTTQNGTQVRGTPASAAGSEAVLVDGAQGTEAQTSLDGGFRQTEDETAEND